MCVGVSRQIRSVSFRSETHDFASGSGNLQHMYKGGQIIWIKLKNAWKVA